MRKKARSRDRESRRSTNGPEDNLCCNYYRVNWEGRRRREKETHKREKSPNLRPKDLIGGNEKGTGFKDQGGKA